MILASFLQERNVPMEQTTVSTPTRARLRWNTRELLTAVVIALAFAVLLVPFTFAYAAILSLGIFARSAMTGLFFLPAAFAAYVLRKPGAVLLVSAVSGLAATPFTGYGPLLLLIGLLTGAIGELAAWVVTRYRKFDWPHIIAMGAMSGTVEFLLVLFSLRISEVNLPAIALATGLSTAAFVVAAIVARSLAEAVKRTGALANTALGRDTIQDV